MLVNLKFNLETERWDVSLNAVEVNRPDCFNVLVKGEQEMELSGAITYHDGEAILNASCQYYDPIHKALVGLEVY